MKRHQIISASVLLLISACQSAPVENTTEESNLGVLNHQFDISELAQENFDKGLLLIHSFEYDDANEAFEGAIDQDSTEVMAYWGAAMSHYKALWGLQNIEAGRAVLSRLAPTKEERLAIANGKIEEDFLEAVEILYGDGELFERNKAYADHMGQLYSKYQGNQEVAAFYALGLMWSVEGGRDPAIFDKSASVASGILEENPQHPGALHYLIHANDDPDYAKLSKIAADQYSKVAPDAAHALHMPSHIYLALGMWNDVVASNEQSYAASISRMERKGLDDKARGYHSYAWLHYGYLQQGRYDKAEALLKDMHTYTERSPSRGAKSYLVTMQNAQKVESGEWPEGIEPMYIDYGDLGLSSKSSQHFFKALIAFENDNVAAIKEEIATVETLVIGAELVVSDNGIAICSAGPTRYAPNQSDIYKANVLINQMKAMIAMLESDDNKTEEYLIAATDFEDKSEYSYGPPDIPLPSYEQYGEWLLTKNRPEDAIVQFDRSLENAQNRAKALHGKIKALTMLARMEEADAIKEVLNGFWREHLVASN